MIVLSTEMRPSNLRRTSLMATVAAVTALATRTDAGAYLMRPDKVHIRTSHQIKAPHPLTIHSNILFPLSITSNSIRPHKKSDQLTRFYVEEWADADTELALHSESNHAPTRLKRSIPLFQRLTLKLAMFIQQMRELIRTKIERCTVYILQLENGKYYVGSTTNRKKRIQEHIKRKGSKWTREHKPIGVLREYRRIPSRYVLGMESRITAECMLEFGVNNVRGSMFCGTREFHMGDVAALTKFIGHYNDLNYRKVSRRLADTLPAAPRRFRPLYNDGKCYRCGKKGHIAAKCPERQLKLSKRQSDVFA